MLKTWVGVSRPKKRNVTAANDSTFEVRFAA